MKRARNKSDCPINFSVELFGDQWSLLLLRDMLIFGKKTFSEFLASKERIGRSTLSERLATLERDGIISKQASVSDRRGTTYWPTDTGLKLIPLMYELALWGATMSPLSDGGAEWKRALALDRSDVIACWERAVRSKDSFLVGPQSVVEQLGIAGI